MGRDISMKVRYNRFFPVLQVKELKWAYRFGLSSPRKMMDPFWISFRLQFALDSVWYFCDLSFCHIYFTKLADWDFSPFIYHTLWFGTVFAARYFSPVHHVLGYCRTGLEILFIINPKIFYGTRSMVRFRWFPE